MALPWLQQETCCALQQATVQACMFLKADMVCTALSVTQQISAKRKHTVHTQPGVQDIASHNMVAGASKSLTIRLFALKNA